MGESVSEKIRYGRWDLATPPANSLGQKRDKQRSSGSADAHERSQMAHRSMVLSGRIFRFWSKHAPEQPGAVPRKNKEERRRRKKRKRRRKKEYISQLPINRPMAALLVAVIIVVVAVVVVVVVVVVVISTV